MFNSPKDWRAEISGAADPVKRVGDSFILLDSVTKGSLFGSASQPFALDDMMLIVFCYQGEAHFTLDMREYSLKAPFLATIRNKKICDVDSVSDDYQAFYYCLSEDFANKLFFNLRDTYDFNRCMRERPAFNVDSGAMDDIQMNKSLILRTLEQTDNPFRIDAVRCLVQAMYFSYKDKYFTPPARISHVGHHTEYTANKFLNLVRDYHLQERGVTFYAEKLCMTPKYLSRVVKQTTGKTAYAWISDAVIQEAKMMLRCTDKTIYEVSEQMGFSSQVFFCKYFRNVTGMSPREYRKSLENS